MQGKVKLSKRQLKEDKFTTFMLTSKDRVQDNWQLYVFGALALILVVVAVTYFMNAGQSTEQAAADALSEAESLMRTGQNDAAVVGLDRVVQDYSGTRAAEQALFTLARVNYNLKNYDESERYFQQFLDKILDDKMNRAACLAGLAAIIENRGEYALAAEKHLEVIAELPDGPLVSESRYSALRNYLAVGDTGAAKQQLDLIEAEFPNSQVSLKAIRLYAEKTSGQ